MNKQKYSVRAAKGSEVNKNLSLGRLALTVGVNNQAAEDIEFSKFVMDSLGRHMRGDWGDLCQGDKDENDWAWKSGKTRICSAYKDVRFPLIFIITEWDRSATTILFPYEY